MTPRSGRAPDGLAAPEAAQRACRLRAGGLRRGTGAQEAGRAGTGQPRATCRASTDDELRRSLEQQIEVIQSRRAAHADAQRRQNWWTRNSAACASRCRWCASRRCWPPTRTTWRSRWIAVSASLNEANRWLKDQRELFAGLENFMDEPPPADLLGFTADHKASEESPAHRRRAWPDHRQRGAAAIGNIITAVLLVGLVALGAWLWLGRKGDSAAPGRAVPRHGRCRHRESPTAMHPCPSSP